MTDENWLRDGLADAVPPPPASPDRAAGARAMARRARRTTVLAVGGAAASVLLAAGVVAVLQGGQDPEDGTDLVAPGEKILSARADFEKLIGRSRNAGSIRTEQLYVAESGTSMAAPHVSGILAAFLSMRREFVGYPDRVKKILLDNCTDLGRDAYAQGAGLPNLVQMLAGT